MTTKRLPVMEDYLKLHYVGDPACCAEKKLIAWTGSYWNMDAPAGFRRYREQIHLARWEACGLTEEQILSAGGFVERSPAFGADGSVFFLSDASFDGSYPEAGKYPQRVENELFAALQLWRWQEGSLRQLTHMLHGVNRFVLSPNRKQIFFTSWKYESDTTEQMTRERTAEERQQRLKELLCKPFVTESARYKTDAEMGYRSLRRNTLWLLDLKNGEVRCLIDGQSDFMVPGWMPDSETILFQRTNENDKLEFCTLSVNTGEIAVLTQVENVEACDEEDYVPMIDMVNGQLLFAGTEPGAEYADPRGLYAIALAGGKELVARRLLSPEADIDGLFPQDMNFSSRGSHESELLLINDRCFYTTGVRGDVRIAAVPVTADHGTPLWITGEMANYHALCRYDDTYLLAVCGLPTKLPELAMVNMQTGETTILTNSNLWMEGVALQKPQSVWTASGTHGFYLPPVGQTEKSPAVLYCHGGPTGFFCSGMNYELQVLAAAGFCVLYANPRGGTGYGRARNKDEFAYDGSALADLVEFVDTVCAQHPELDPERIGVFGGSYGGYLTLSLAAHTDRFKAASSHRALANMQMISASSHSAGHKTREEFPDVVDWMYRELEQSPTSYVDKITIPLQIMQSDLDANCVPEQANQVCALMRALHPEVPCQYLRYPDSGHGLYYKGPMELAVHSRQATMEWFQTHL